MAGSSCVWSIVAPLNADGTPVLNSSMRRYRCTWTSDDTDGTASGATSTAPAFTVTGLLLGIETNPGATAPTDNYDLTVTNNAGVDILGGNGADRDTTNSEFVQPKDTQGVITPFPLCGDTLTANISAAGNSKLGVFDLLVELR